MININNLYSSKVINLINKDIKKNNISNEDVPIIDFINREDNTLISNENKSLLIELMNKNVKPKEYDYNKSCEAYLKVEHSLYLDYKNEITRCDNEMFLLNVLTSSFLNKDDYIICIKNDPCISNISKFIEGKVYECEVNKFNNYLIDFDEIEDKILKKCKILYLNYPDVETGATANREFFETVIKYAKKYNFMVVNNASNIDLCFKEIDKLSFLSVSGAKDVGIEFFDISFNLDMGEFKIGFIAGNKEIIKSYQNIKNIFYCNELQLSEIIAVKLLEKYDSIMKNKKEKYLKRYELISNCLKENNLKINDLKVGNYCSFKMPSICNGVKFESASEFSLWLKEKENILVNYNDKEKNIQICLDFICDDKVDEETIIEEFNKRLKKYTFN